MSESTLLLIPTALPPEVETYWADGVGEADWARLEATVQVLSDGFTTGRGAGFTDYTATPGQQHAYGLFFFPRTWTMCRFPLNELIQYWGWQPAAAAGQPFRILDLGCGTGAAGLSAANGLRTAGLRGPIEIHGIDHSRGALDRMEALVRAVPQGFTDCTVRTETVQLGGGTPRLEAERYDLIICSFALNELAATTPGFNAVTWLAGLKPALRAGGKLLVLEPALRETARSLQQSADQLMLEQTYHGWGPYLHGAPCPLLSSERFWNHEVRLWQPPASLQRLNRKLWRSIGELKFSYTVLGSEPPAPQLRAPAMGPASCRLVSPISLMKGHLLWAGVGADGHVHTYELQTRGLKKSAVKALCQIERGTLLHLKDLQAIGDPLRQRLALASGLERLTAPSKSIH